MAVLRINKTKDYTVMSNYHFREKEMSLKAKGLLSQMLSLPESWDYSIAGLVAINKENESSIKSTLNELKKFGYLKVTKLMPNETSSGRIEYVYDIYEQPSDIQKVEKQKLKKQEVENLPLENLDIENQEVENQRQYSINELSIKNTNTNKLNTNELNINYEKIVGRLNELTGASYWHDSKNTRTLIKARFKEGFTENDFITVIDKMCYLWNREPKKGQTDMRLYLRPSTLFGTKFEQYLNTPVSQVNLTTKDLASKLDFSEFHSNENVSNGQLF